MGVSGTGLIMYSRMSSRFPAICERSGLGKLLSWSVGTASGLVCVEFEWSFGPGSFGVGVAALGPVVDSVDDEEDSVDDEEDSVDDEASVDDEDCEDDEDCADEVGWSSTLVVEWTRV